MNQMATRPRRSATEPRATRAALLAAARELFAERGYDGASIRAITRRADANLGAVTYHFGSKEALYHAVIDANIQPLREALAAAVRGAGPPLARIESFLQAAFDYYADHPEIPRLMLQQVASGRPAPPPAREWIRLGLGTIGALIEDGQADGSVRRGDPRFLALGVVSSGLLVHLIRRPLEDAVGLSLAEPATRAAVREHIVRFVHAALAAEAA